MLNLQVNNFFQYVTPRFILGNISENMIQTTLDSWSADDFRIPNFLPRLTATFCFYAKNISEDQKERYRFVTRIFVERSKMLSFSVCRTLFTGKVDGKTSLEQVLSYPISSEILNLYLEQNLFYLGTDPISLLESLCFNEKVFKHVLIDQKKEIADLYLANIIFAIGKIVENEAWDSKLIDFLYGCDMHGYRVFDKIIKHGNANSLVLFYQFLDFLLNSDLISKEDLFKLIATHPKSGHAPIHELIMTDEPDKIIGYLKKINNLFAPESVREILFFRNTKNITALQQLINNGNYKNQTTKPVQASVEVALYIIENFLRFPYFLASEISCVLSTLSCDPAKKGSDEINAELRKLRRMTSSSLFGQADDIDTQMTWQPSPTQPTMSVWERQRVMTTTVSVVEHQVPVSACSFFYAPSYGAPEPSEYTAHHFDHAGLFEK